MIAPVTVSDEQLSLINEIKEFMKSVPDDYRILWQRADILASSKALLERATTLKLPVQAYHPLQLILSAADTELLLPPHLRAGKS